MKLILDNVPGHSNYLDEIFLFASRWLSFIAPYELEQFLLWNNPDVKINYHYTPTVKDTGALFDELQRQLVSGEKTMAQFSLFCKKADYKNPVLCRLMEVEKFYKEVFGYDICGSRSLTKKLQANSPDDNFMIFLPKVSLEDNAYVEKWNRFRYGHSANAITDDAGLLNCNQATGAFSVPPKDFILHNIRDEKQYYALVLIDAWLPSTSYQKVTYSYTSFADDMRLNPEVGITLREGYILSLFEIWKSGKAFSHRNQDQKYAVISCVGSVCKSSDADNTYHPTPLVVLSQKGVHSVWESSNDNSYIGDNPVKIYGVEKYLPYT